MQRGTIVWIGLLALALFTAFYGRHPSHQRSFLWLEIPWLLFWFSWIHYPWALADVGWEKDASSRSLLGRPEIAYGLLWLNGTIVLLISNTGFLSSGDFSGWFGSLPVLATWLVFCSLLWTATHDRQPVFGRMSYRPAVAAVVAAAAVLLSLDIFGAQWRAESRAYAEPLSFCEPLPSSVREARENGVRSDDFPGSGVCQRGWAYAETGFAIWLGDLR